MRTILKSVDNSGAKKVMCIQPLKGKNGARLGDIIIGSVKEAILQKLESRKGRSCTVWLCMLRCRKADDDAVVIVSIKDKNKTNPDGSKTKMEYNQPTGSRVFGPVPHEMRLRKQLKILTLAQHIV